MYEPPVDLRPLRTADGSFTLRSDLFNEQYHSVHGAVQESRHVFLEAGLACMQRPEVDLLEVGLGTGLNAWLTRLAAREGSVVRYTALEPFPVDPSTLALVDHASALAPPSDGAAWLDMMAMPPGEWLQVSPHFSFRQLRSPVQELDATEAFDLVYFDAFGPNAQPEMWTVEVFQQLFKALRAGGLLVTYCAKGDVRRAMLAAGFRAERIPGPPGKRQMLRATKPEEA